MRIAIILPIVLILLRITLRAALQNDIIIARLDSWLDSLQEYEEHLAKHIYLHNNYAPVAAENRAVPAKLVHGSIPEGLEGVFIQIGPNPIPHHLGKKRYHWFDGHGHLHALRIKKNGELLYSNSFIPTPRYQIEKKLDREYFLRLGELKGLVGLAKVLFIEKHREAKYQLDNLRKGQANTHTIMTKQNRFYAVHEGSLPFEIELNRDGSIAGAIGYETFGNILNYPVSAHPKVDYESGNLLFHSYSIDPDLAERDGSFKFGEFSAKTGSIESYFGVKTQDDNHICFGHDMVFTKNWFVIIDSSVHFDPNQIFNKTGNVFSYTQTNLRIGLAPRHRSNTTSDNVIWFDLGKPHVIIHQLNAWEEEDGVVVLWAPCGDHFNMNIDNDADNEFYMAEFRMDVKSGKSEMAVIDDKYNIEFPRIRHDFSGRFGRFATATIMDTSYGGDGLFRGYVKYDLLEKKTSQVVVYPEGDVAGEAVVIPKPGTSESHEFYVGTWVRNTLQEKSFFVLYDGENGKEVARVEIPFRVPHGFHCEWFSEEQLEGHFAYHAKKES